MTKYWDSERIRRMRQRKIKAAERAAEEMKAILERQRTYTRGDDKKNANLMLDALGRPLRRQIVARLRDGGAMSLSKLVEPFGITLPSAHEHLQALERAGIIVTHKRGRVRMCAYNRRALEELAAWLSR